MSSPAPVLVDVESRSRCDLKRRGGRVYWEDPSSEAMILPGVPGHSDPCIQRGEYRIAAAELARRGLK